MAEKFTYITLENEPEVVISTKQDIRQQLESLGVQKGMVLLVQADVSKLGYIVGGAQALIEAIQDVVGFDGTIVMPTFTSQLLDPACHQEQLAREYWGQIRENALPFNRKLTAPKTADHLVNQFLRNEGVARSYHPVYSFAAWGKYAKLICDKHPLHFGLSKDSPLGKIVDFNGYVVLLGTDYSSCTMFDMARYIKERQSIRIINAPIEINQRVEWKSMLELDFDHIDKHEIGEIMEDRSIVASSYIGNSKCRMFSGREAVKIANAYFHLNRKNNS